VPSIAIIAHCALEGVNQVETLPAGGAGDGGHGAGAVCEHALVPTPPDAHTDGGTEFIVALRHINMSEAPDGGPIGYDLDKTCTCQGQSSSCKLPEDADGCDLPGGRDNSLTPMIDLLSFTLGITDLSMLYNSMVEQGDWSLLLRVRDYNGEADDERVAVAVFSTDGLGTPPGWDGNDEWPVTTSSLEPGGTLEDPLFFDPFAYVAGGILVASLPELDFIFSGSSGYLAIKMSSGFITGRIEPHGAGYALRDAVMTGRVAVPDLFAAVSTVHLDGGSLCRNDPAYGMARAALCNRRDLTVTALAPTMPCDAISWGLAFEAEPARLGTIVAAAVPDSGCPPATDPAYDSCD